MNENEEKVVKMIEKIDKKDFGFYFFTLDTKGNPVASIITIYEHVKVLNDLGYNAYILHEKNDYTGVGEWLGEEYANLPHKSIEAQSLSLSSVDYIIIPEVFANIMEQVKGFPAKKIVLLQSYNYVLELLAVGKKWDTDFGFTDVITTSQIQSDYIQNLFPSIKTYIIPPSIPDYFKPTDKLKMPIVSIVTREQGDALKLVKAFYLQYPLYKWLTFKELRGLPRKKFAEELGKSCLAVWVDDISGFGTFPLEAMECNTPVIGKIPNLIPEWMVFSDGVENGEVELKDNGIWTNNILSIPTLINKFMDVWVEDSVPNELITDMEKSRGNYTIEKQNNKIKEVYENFVIERKHEFENLINVKSEK